MMRKYEYVMAGFVFMMLIFLASQSSNITGHVAASYSVSDVKIAVESNQTYLLKIDEPLQTILISGKVIGEGSAKVFLGYDKERYLIYSRLVGNSLNEITGMVASGDTIHYNEDNKNSDEDKEVNVYLELLLGSKKEGLYDELNEKQGHQFKDVCMETCFLPSLQKEKYYLIIETDLGTSLLIDKIVYVTE